MSLPRWTLVLLACLALSLSPAQDTEGPPPVEVSPLTGPLHLLVCNANAAVVASVGEDGVLLVDTGYAFTAEALREAVAGLGAGPARIIVNTHGDGDHVGGNGALGEEAVIIAHPAVRRQMSAFYALPAVATEGLPSVTVEKEASVHFNGEEIRLLPMPGGHTSADMVVHFTGSKVACIGDLVLKGTFPNASPARGGDARRLIEVLKGLRKILPAETTVVAAHGGAMTLVEVDAYVEMIEGTLAAVEAEMKKGKTLSQVIESNPLEPWAAWERADRGLSFAAWTREAYASLAGSGGRSICEPVTETLVKEGIEAAVATYRRLRESEPERWSFAEYELNMLGYQLLARERVEEAIAVFELNVEYFPEAFNTHDSLGEGYMTAGQREEAIASYERSLELNPENANGAAMLERLREE
jgi:glyoxylase-like metal-dependent hydrolase (beta-lactamase superfamily II)